MSWTVFDVDCGMDRVATSTTETSFTVGAGAVTGSDLGCTETELFALGASALLSPSDGALCTIRLGFFGVVSAADVFEPNFLSFTVAVDLLPVSLPFESSRSVALSVPLVPDCAASSPDVDGDDGEPASEPDESEDDDDPSDESEDEDESELDDSEFDESDDELEESVSDGPAKATPGVVATAIPTPNATAKPPTRPTYLA